jgi:hypothetical protein
VQSKEEVILEEVTGHEECDLSGHVDGFFFFVPLSPKMFSQETFKILNQGMMDFYRGRIKVVQRYFKFGNSALLLF